MLLLDADLRRGSQAGLLGTRPDPGLAEALLGQVSVETAIQRGQSESLYLLPSGRKVQDPGELMTGSKLQHILQQLRPAFDWIVIDTPPVIHFADAGVIANMCDGIVMVVGAGITPVALVKRAHREIKKYPILGVVLNRMKQDAEASKYLGYYERNEN